MKASGWLVAALGDVATLHQGFGFPKSLQGRLNGPIGFYKVSDISRAVAAGSDHLGPAIHYITSEEARSIRARVLPKGAVVFARIGEALKLNRRALLPTDALVDNNVIGVKGLPGIEDRYLLYFLRTIDLGSLSQATTVPAVRTSDIQSIQVPVAPHNEQVRVASRIDELFSEIGEGERALERVQKLVERYRQSVLKAAVTGELTREWRRKQKGQIESGEALLQRTLKARRAAWEREALLQMRASNSTPKSDNWKQKYPEPVPPNTTELPELPPEWTWASIDQVGLVSGGLTKNQKRDECELRRPFLRVANVYANRLDLTEVHEIGLSAGELDRVLLKSGDLLVVEGNGSVEQIGRVALWDGSIERCVHQNHLIKIRCTEVLPSWYSLIWCMSPHGREQIRRVASSTSGLHTLSISKVQALPIPIPTGAELQVIQDRFQEMESLVTQQLGTISHQQTRAVGLRQAVLRLAFAGRLVPQDLTDEPATAFLERIAADRTPHSVLAARRGRAKKTAT